MEMRIGNRSFRLDVELVVAHANDIRHIHRDGHRRGSAGGKTSGAVKMDAASITINQHASGVGKAGFVRQDVFEHQIGIGSGLLQRHTLIFFGRRSHRVVERKIRVRETCRIARSEHRSFLGGQCTDMVGSGDWNAGQILLVTSGRRRSGERESGETANNDKR